MVKDWLFVGSAFSGACNSPVSAFDSVPVTYSVPVRGSKSPSSVASIKCFATRVVDFPFFKSLTRSDETLLLVTTAFCALCCSNKVSCPVLRYLDSISIITACATRGSWQSLDTAPSPGFRLGLALASSVRG